MSTLEGLQENKAIFSIGLNILQFSAIRTTLVAYPSTVLIDNLEEPPGQELLLIKRPLLSLNVTFSTTGGSEIFVSMPLFIKNKVYGEVPMPTNFALKCSNRNIYYLNKTVTNLCDYDSFIKELSEFFSIYELLLKL